MTINRLFDRTSDHTKQHSDERPFECHFPDCDFRSKTKNGLRAHHNAVHSKLKRCECHVCEKKFFSPSRVRKHILRAHVKEGHDMQSCAECQRLTQVDRKRSEAMKAAFRRKKQQNTANGSELSVNHAEAKEVTNDLLSGTHSLIQEMADLF